MSWIVSRVIALQLLALTAGLTISQGRSLIAAYRRCGSRRSQLTVLVNYQLITATFSKPMAYWKLLCHVVRCGCTGLLNTWSLDISVAQISNTVCRFMSYGCLNTGSVTCLLARRPYSLGRRMTARLSLASNPLYLLLQWRCIKCESTFACTFAFYTYWLSRFRTFALSRFIPAPLCLPCVALPNDKATLQLTAIDNDDEVGL